MVLALIGAMFVPAVSAESQGKEFASDETLGKLVKVDSPNIELIENTKTSSIAKVGDVLITLKSNQEHTDAVLDIEDLKTKEKETIQYKVSEKSGKYTTEMFYKGELVRTDVTDYDPLEPGTAGEALRNTNKGTETSVNQASSKASHYYWDGVYFASGSGIKYPHPDYQAYGAEPWEGFYIDGNQLYHRHIKDSDSNTIASMPAAVAGAAVGVIVGNLVGLTVGTIVGAALTLALGNSLGSVLLDENDCIWFWDAKSWAMIPNPTPPYTPVQLPKYMRIASYTLWDGLGIGNP